MPQKSLCKSFLLVLAVTLMCTAGTVESSGPAPELSLKDRLGKEQSLSAYRGKIVVLNFWATWCMPCRHELPMLDRLAELYKDKDVVIVAASIDAAESQNKIPHFLEKKKITLPIWVGATPDTLKQFQLGEIVPATIILDRDGQAIGRIMGEAQRKDITSRVDWVLKGREGKRPKLVLKNF